MVIVPVPASSDENSAPGAGSPFAESGLEPASVSLPAGAAGAPHAESSRRAHRETPRAGEVRIMIFSIIDIGSRVTVPSLKREGPHDFDAARVTSG
jgi:hypothetical protein